MPQLVIGSLAETGEDLPLIEQRTKPVGSCFPVVLGGDLLGFLDDAGLFDLRLGNLGDPCDFAFLAQLVDGVGVTGGIGQRGQVLVLAVADDELRTVF